MYNDVLEFSETGEVILFDNENYQVSVPLKLD